jgi:WD40 repeat protein
MAVSTATGKMATAGRDGTIKLWDLNDGTLVMALTEPGPPAYWLAFSDDGKLLTAIDDDVVRVFALDVAALVEIARSRTTRDLTEAECRQYLHSEGC